MDAPRNRQDGGLEGVTFPLRAFWLIPAATVIVAGCEIVVFEGRRLEHTLEVLAALFTVVAYTLPAAILCAMVVARFRRRLDDLWAHACQRAEWLVPALPAILIVIALTEVAFVPLGARIAGLGFDFSSDVVLVERTLALVVLPLLLIGVYALIRGAQHLRWLRNHPKRVWACAFSTIGIFATPLLLDILYVDYIPWASVFGGLAASALVVGPWLPSKVSLRAGLKGSVLAAVLAIPVGAWGTRDLETRALLFHNTHALPRLARLVALPFDLDGDQIRGTWAGGTDCDDFDPNVSTAQHEIPGNGIDDNCRLGDGTSAILGAQPHVGPAENRPVVLLTIESVRADHLQSFGYHRDTMPTLERIKEGCLNFKRAYSPSNRTQFSVISFLSGQSAEYLVRNKRFGTHKTFWMPDHLRAAGYETASFLAPFESMKAPATQAGFSSVVQGALEYNRTNRGTVSSLVRHWIFDFLSRRESQKPLFLWWRIPEPHARHESFGPFTGGYGPIDAYDNELLYADYNLGKFVGRIDEYLPGALVIITSDHGEDFRERGVRGHGFHLLESQIHVPLLVCRSGQPAREIERPVSLDALPATVFDALGWPRPAGVQSASLLQAPIREGVVVSSPFFDPGIQKREIALIERRYKLIYNRIAETYLLFDLESDPGEITNLVDEAPDVFARMRAELYRRIETHSP